MAGRAEQVGTGEHAVLCLSGWFGSSNAWAPMQPYVDRSRFSYHFPDYRGYGARRGEQGEHSIAEAAADVLAFADSHGLGRFSLLGHSMGGSVMQRVLAEAPNRVLAMVGVSPVPASGVPFDEDSWALFCGAADSENNRRAILDLTTGNRLTGVWLDAMVRHSLEHSDRDAFADYLQAWACTDFHDAIKGNTTPVRVIVGEHDPALGAEPMRQTFLQWYPNAELVVFGNAGHYAIDETPIALVSSVEDFLGAQ